MRAEVTALVSFGRLPAENEASTLLEPRQALLSAITPPVTDEEACALALIFGADSCFGLAWALVHLVGSAPHWPLWECLPHQPEWRDRMLTRLRNAGYSVPREFVPDSASLRTSSNRSGRSV